jgi:chemotaxis protein CheD
MSADKLLSIHPGDWYFGGDYTRLHTVLGSCVALAVWHPEHKVGGMCHCLLPVAAGRRDTALPDCRYAEHALPKLKQAMLQYGELRYFVVGLFGGGDMFSRSARASIGEQNILYAQQWLVNEQIGLQRMDVGGAMSRSLTLHMRTGEIHVKRYNANPANRM